MAVNQFIDQDPFSSATTTTHAAFSAAFLDLYLRRHAKTSQQAGYLATS